MMSRIQDTDMVFIAGVEGSGTTMMSCLLENLSGYASIGGNHCSTGFEAFTQRINALTERLWALPRVATEEKNSLLLQLNALTLPKQVHTGVYKRSYPFLTSGYMPDLADLSAWGKTYKVILLRRHFIDNVRSIMRRGFEAQETLAIQRIAQGHMHLTQQVQRLDADHLLVLDYEKLIDSRCKQGEIERLALFLGQEIGILQGLAALIGKPTSGETT